MNLNTRQLVLLAIALMLGGGLAGVGLWSLLSKPASPPPAVEAAASKPAEPTPAAVQAPPPPPPAPAVATTTPPPPPPMAPPAAPVNADPVSGDVAFTWAKTKRYVFPVSQQINGKIVDSGEECPLTVGALASIDAEPASSPDLVRLKVVTAKVGDCRATAIVETNRSGLASTFEGLGTRLAAKIRASGGGVVAQAAAPSSGGRTPMLIPGKKTLYQRVLTRPGALLANDRNGSGEGEALPAFSMFFVYSRVPGAGGDWLEVGSNRNGLTDGWIAASQTIEWKQTLTVNFNNPGPRNRAMFFRSPDELSRLVGAEGSQAIADSLLAEASRGKVEDDFPVIAMEPATYIDFTKQFYLLPILDWRETRTAAGFSTRLLRVASVSNAQGGKPSAGQASGAASSAAEMSKFTASVVFVVDTTRSMQPYIERTQVAVGRILQKINGDPALKGKVSFGLVAFRNNLQKTPKLEYVNKVFVDLEEGRDIPTFLSGLATVKATDVSSHSWDEDSIGGLVRAVNELSWDKFAGRYLIMFTDAGSLRANDSLSSTQLDPEQVNRLLQDKNIAPFILHLKTAAGKADHASAAQQYKTIAEVPNIGSLYFPIEGGSVEDYGHVVDSVIDQLSTSLAKAAKGEIESGGGSANKGGGTAETQARAKAATVSRAMQLAYLGRERETQVPAVLDSWITDRDIGQPDIATLEVRVLMTKNELSDLQQTMKLVVEAAKKSEIAPADFFNQLRSAAASMSRDPGKVGSQQSRKLADLGLIGEYLDDLPYKSKVMNLDQETWESWGITEQQAFIDEIEAKIRLYQRFHDDTGRWVMLDGGKSGGDAVYPVPIDSLP